jgi:hypothetical protein
MPRSRQDAPASKYHKPRDHGHSSRRDIGCRTKDVCGHRSSVLIAGLDQADVVVVLVLVIIRLGSEPTRHWTLMPPTSGSAHVRRQARPPEPARIGVRGDSIPRPSCPSTPTQQSIQQSLHHRPRAHRQTFGSPSHLQVSSSGRRLLRANSSLATPRRTSLLVVFLQVKEPRRAASATTTSAAHPIDATPLCQHTSDSPARSTAPTTTSCRPARNKSPSRRRRMGSILEDRKLPFCDLSKAQDLN